MSIERKIIVTDSGGLVGRNLVHRVTARTRIVAIDKHPSNTATLARVSSARRGHRSRSRAAGELGKRFSGRRIVESGLSACVLRPPPKEWIEASCGVRIYLGFGSCCLTSNL